MFGLTLKCTEKNKGGTACKYKNLIETYPRIEITGVDEIARKQMFLGCLDEELLRHTALIVLGLNDATTGLTGASAGFIFALSDTKTIFIAGHVTGSNAAFSKAAFGYLSAKANGNSRVAKPSFYIGTAYLITVVPLVLSLLFMPNKFSALAIFIIFLFYYDLSVIRDMYFKKRFAEMAAISPDVAVLSFGIS
jgi:VIT1/CCC1 family predicted Fe2+/Mn2+ transporter